jgi:hypothetical protein
VAEANGRGQDGNMDERGVDEAVSAMLEVLTPHADADWSTQAGSVEWTCRSTAAHVAHDLLAYAAQVAARPLDRYLPLDLMIRHDATVSDTLTAVRACGSLLSRAIAASPPGAVAWHYGPTDPSGFAAMGAAETLLHTYDITRGLGLEWLPPRALCVAILQRLVPGAPDGDPAQVVLWATGRADLAGHRRVTEWAWTAANG